MSGCATRIDREIDRGSVDAEELPFKDQAIRAAAYGGSGRETEYRVQGNPGLVLVVQQPAKDGTTTKIWRAYYSRVDGGRQIKRKQRLGKYPAVSLAQARRLAAEIAEAVDRGLDPVAAEHAQRTQRERDGLTLADLITDYIEDQRRSAVATVGEIERALNRDIVPTLGASAPGRDCRRADRGRHRRRRGSAAKRWPGIYWSTCAAFTITLFGVLRNFATNTALHTIPPTTSAVDAAANRASTVSHPSTIGI